MLSEFCNFVQINPKFYFYLSESQKSMWIKVKHKHTQLFHIKMAQKKKKINL